MAFLFQNDLITPRPYQSVLMHENGTRKMTAKHKVLDVYSNGNLADGEETSSERYATEIVLPGFTMCKHRHNLSCRRWGGRPHVLTLSLLSKKVY